jgi:hypothetical protein
MDFAQYPVSPEAFGWLASSLTLATFMCSDMRRLRCVALGANAAFIAYGALAHLWPVLVLHLLLVPVNLWRLAGAMGVRTPDAPAGETRRAARHAARDERQPPSGRLVVVPESRRVLH